ncbi:ribose-5-phosphate isomerase RpiA [Hutsoniella sourekii]|uniref:ribose-5-phosphate isomerase RpiA n=1 Tax=Hutsoniella sourekii TaxID=87650 RepID=UPI000482776E|nr:ribose-5-phosphate isomerase RpiA [Hutsoniella sourekii]
MSLAKQVAGCKAVDYVEDGMIVGLGTGSTANYFIDELASRIQSGQLKHIVAVATSQASFQRARQLGINVLPLDEVNSIDLLVDGADETLRTFTGIKGGGGALLHEKIVAQNSLKVIWIVDESKLVEQLGAFPLPVEVVQYGSWKLFRKFENAQMKPQFRKSGRDSLFITDSGNYIIDLNLGMIPSPDQVSFQLNNMVGVVEHGLFINYPDLIIVGDNQGEVSLIERD